MCFAAGVSGKIRVYRLYIASYDHTFIFVKLIPFVFLVLGCVLPINLFFPLLVR